MIDPESSCAHVLFEEQAERTPSGTALLWASGTITFSALNSESNQLARYLRRLGVGPDVLVGLHMERSPEAVVAILAILKAGGGYVPLNSANPQLEEVIQNSPLAAIIVDSDIESPGMAGSIPVVRFRRPYPFLGETIAAVDSGVCPDNIAYVMYTSGSTGRPKGIVGTHRGITHGLEAVPVDDDRSGEIWALQSSLNFGASISRLFLPLMCGIPVALIPEQAANDASLLVKALEAAKVTNAVLIAPLLRQILLSGPRMTSHLSNLRTVLTAGSLLTADLVTLFRRLLPQAKLLNGYAISEVGGAVASGPVEDNTKDPSLGHVFPSTQLYFLNEKMEEVADGEVGEMYVGGSYLARGYWHEPGLTAERFLPNPFSSGSGARLYRTGDFGRSLPDGRLQWVGRSDEQVKIRGYRVELTEVESALSGIDHVSESAVAAQFTDGDPNLTAYIVLTPGIERTVRDIRQELAKRLPEYMIPSAFVFLSNPLPRRSTGKLDRQALPSPEPSLMRRAQDYVPPRNAAESAIALAWADVFQMERIGIHDNFLELGGHSLIAIQISSKLSDRFSMDLPPHLVLQFATVAELAAAISGVRVSG